MLPHQVIELSLLEGCLGCMCNLIMTIQRLYIFTTLRTYMNNSVSILGFELYHFQHPLSQRCPSQRYKHKPERCQCCPSQRYKHTPERRQCCPSQHYKHTPERHPACFPLSSASTLASTPPSSLSSWRW